MREGYNPECVYIQTEKDFKSALANHHWDLIISDYALPEFDGLKALKILRESGYDTPFLLISGEIGEELAVEIMKAGANDYLMKDNLARLVPVIERELKEAKNRKRHKKAETQRKRLEKIVQQSVNEVYIINSETLKFEYANNIALENLGYNLRELLKLTPVDINIGLARKNFSLLLQPLLNGKKQKVLKYSLHRRKNGTNYPVEMHLQAIREEGKTFFASIILDLTSHRRSEEIIREQKMLTQKIINISNYKSDFIANVSHELRTPLNSILLLSNLLSNKLKNSYELKHAEYADEINNSAVSLMELISDILDLSKIEAGEMTYNISDINVTSLIESAANSFYYHAKQKELELKVINSIGNQQFIKSDAIRIKQICKNLLSNATKFTESGSITVNLYLPEKEEVYMHFPAGGSFVAISVSDTGIGISTKNHNKIFEAFGQADSPDAKKYKGTGLGLSISNEIATGLGGKITLKSRPGIGSNFTVYLPLDSRKFIEEKKLIYKPISKSLSIKKTYSNKKSTKEKTAVTKLHSVKNYFNVLLVDDSEIHTEALKELIDDQYKRCLIANSGKEALSITNNLAIDMAIIDLGLPDIDGFEVAKAIRKKHAFDKVPIIIYSGKKLSTAQMAPYNDIINQFIEKTGGSFQEIETVIDNFLDLSKEKQSDKSNNNNGNQKSSIIGRTILIVDDNKKNIYALKKVLEHNQVKVISATNAKEAFKHLKMNIPIDLILMDLMMPEVNGLEATQIIRKEKKWNKIPIFAVTAQAKVELKKQCFDAGMSDFITKPVDTDRLLESIEKQFK